MDILKEIAKLSKQGLDIEFLRTDNDVENEESMLKITVSWKVPNSENRIGKGLAVNKEVYDSYEDPHKWIVDYLVKMAKSVEDYKTGKMVKSNGRD